MLLNRIVKVHNFFLFKGKHFCVLILIPSFRTVVIRTSFYGKFSSHCDGTSVEYENFTLCTNTVDTSIWKSNFCSRSHFSRTYIERLVKDLCSLIRNTKNNISKLCI